MQNLFFHCLDSNQLPVLFPISPVVQGLRVNKSGSSKRAGIIAFPSEGMGPEWG